MFYVDLPVVLRQGQLYQRIALLRAQEQAHSNGIQQFLAGVDPVILSRGQDYFRSGNVESIKWDPAPAV